MICHSQEKIVSLLQLASRHGCTNCMQSLLEHGADVNYVQSVRFMGNPIFICDSSLRELHATSNHLAIS